MALTASTHPLPSFDNVWPGNAEKAMTANTLTSSTFARERSVRILFLLREHTPTTSNWVEHLRCLGYDVRAVVVALQSHASARGKNREAIRPSWIRRTTEKYLRPRIELTLERFNPTIIHVMHYDAAVTAVQARLNWISASKDLEARILQAPSIVFVPEDDGEIAKVVSSGDPAVSSVFSSVPFLFSFSNIDREALQSIRIQPQDLGFDARKITSTLVHNLYERVLETVEYYRE
jgi:hypothetical protein